MQPPSRGDRAFRVALHHLVDVPFSASPNHAGELVPEAVVIHYTAGGTGAATWLCNPLAKASAHLVINRAGAVTQLVAFNRRAWHAGRSVWQGRTGLNGWSIGIELENWGPLRRQGDVFLTWTGRQVPRERVGWGTHKHGGRDRWWEVYPAPQLKACIEACRALVAAYPTIATILGHDDVAPGRKRDPGPLFPMAMLKRACLVPRGVDCAVSEA